jgi:hypothetical protein
VAYSLQVYPTKPCKHSASLPTRATCPTILILLEIKCIYQLRSEIAVGLSMSWLLHSVPFNGMYDGLLRARSFSTARGNSNHELYFIAT